VAAEDNKAIVQRFYDEVINQRRFDVLDDLLAPHFRGFQLPHRNQSSSRPRFREILQEILSAFPDYHETIEDWIVAEDKIVTRWTFRGTHTGSPYFGILATGRPVIGTGIDIFRLENGKLIEHWAEVDLLGIMSQLGKDPS